jgi:hypothetical protein
VPPEPLPPTTACTHDLGPGTTVCLRCRQERRDTARARQQRLFALSGVAAMGLLGVYVMGASAANAWHAAAAKDAMRVPARASVTASSVNVPREVKQQGESAPPAAPAPVPALAAADSASTAVTPSTISPTVAPPAAAPPAAATPTVATPVVAAPASRPPFALVVREGQTNLPDSVIVARGGDSVIVDFDTQSARTRRRHKFERVVRQTLPMVYGARIDSVLRAIPEGDIGVGADLLTELPKRGVHLKVAEGWTLDLWPETRAGQDGPVVVSYRARISRDGALR